MTEKTTISVIVLFIVNVLLLSGNMCQSQHSNNTDYNAGLENNTAEIIKDFIDKDIVSNVSGQGARLSDYMMDLYTALDNVEKADLGHKDNFPKIRSFRGLKGGEDKVTFQLTNVWNSRVKRVELALKLYRTRQGVPGGHTYKLLVHGASHGSVEYVSQSYSNYLVFDISDLKDTLPNNISIDKSLISNTERIRISRHNEPLLLVYENLQHNPLLNGEHRLRRQKRHVERVFNYRPGGVNSESCQRKNWEVHLNVFPGLDWWLFPREYNAGYCDGQCRFPLTREATNSTSYSFLKNVWHTQTFFLDDFVPQACCVPVEYEPLQIIYLTNSIEQDIMMIDNMIVTSCGCR